MSLIFASAAAQTGNPPELTALVGVLGAVVGGGIGLLGQRMNILEQRRKHQRERVLDMLNDCNLLRITLERYLSRIRHGSYEEAGTILAEIPPLLANFLHSYSHVELSAPWRLQQRTDRLVVCTQDFTNQVLDIDPSDREAAEALDRKAGIEAISRAAVDVVNYLTPRAKKVARALQTIWSSRAR